MYMYNYTIIWNIRGVPTEREKEDKHECAIHVDKFSIKSIDMYIYTCIYRYISSV